MVACGELIHGLDQWLAELHLSGHAGAVGEWCEEQGAASLAEVVENRDDLSSSLSLTLEEREGLLSKHAEQVANLISARTYGEDLESILLAVMRVLEDDQIIAVEGFLTARQHVLFRQKARQTGIASKSRSTSIGAAPVQCESGQTKERRVPISASNAHIVREGQWAELHVLSGSWMGCHVCEVVATRLQSFRLRHYEDNFEENIPFAVLNGSLYSMDLLLNEEVSEENSLRDAPRVLTKSQSVGAASQVEMTRAARISKRDSELIRMASGCAVNGYQDELCTGCRRSAWNGQMSQDDGMLYCNECWMAWKAPARAS